MLSSTNFTWSILEYLDPYVINHKEKTKFDQIWKAYHYWTYFDYIQLQYKYFMDIQLWNQCFCLFLEHFNNQMLLSSPYQDNQ